MSSSSKIKNLSQVSSAVNFTNSSSVSSAADAENFNDLFEKTRIDDVSAQNGAGDQSGQENAQDSKTAAQPKQAKKTEGSDGGRKTEDARSAENSEEAEGASEDAELSAEEKNKIEEMEQYRLSVDELAKQLNVAMAALQEVKPQAPNIKIVVKGPEQADVRTALKSIDPALLRKVDIRALDEQLKKLMNGDGLIDVEVPRPEDASSPGFSDLMAQTAGETAAAENQIMISEDTAKDALDEALRAVSQERGGIGADVLDKLEEINVDGRVRVDFREALGKIGERGDLISSWQDRLKDMKDGAQSLNLTTTDTVAEAGENASDIFMESMRSYADKTRFDLTETASGKRFTFDGGADLPAPTGANGPVVTKDLFLSVPMAVRGAGLSGVTGNGEVRPVDFSKAGALDARVAAKIGAKVQEIVMESAQMGKSETTRIQIHPETLGKIDIKISMKEKSVSAEIVTDNPEAKEAILRHLPQIKAVLASENLMLDHFSARHDQQHFLSQQQSAAYAGDGAGGQGERGGSSRDTASGPSDGAAAQRIAKRYVANDSLINITV